MTSIRTLIIVIALLGTGIASAQAIDGASVTETPLDHAAIRPALPPGPLVLPLEVDMVAAKTFINLGFGIDENIHFQATEMLTPRLRTVQAQQLIALVRSYNNFDGEKVAAALSDFRGQISGIQFGREGSPVIYIELPYWTHQREEVVPSGMGKRISDEDNEKLTTRIRKVFVNDLAADEFDVDRRRIRIWWD